MTAAILEILFGALLGPLFLVGFFRNTIPLVRVTRHGTSAEGTIVGFKSRQLQYRTMQQLVIQFSTADGQRVEFTDTMSRQAGRQRGETVTVHYSPRRPAGTATTADTGHALKVAAMAGVLTIMMTGMLVVGILVVVGVIPAGNS
jgi:hypothetical protein